MLVSEEINVLWTVEPGTGGSDHSPINVVHPTAAPKTIKECKRYHSFTDFEPAARIPQSVSICTAARQIPDAQLVVILKTQPMHYVCVQSMRISEKCYCDPTLQLDFPTPLPKSF
ncbi:hypothetical protein HPB47_022026 [Ixodes persulcatus]|uniref:Uncharacterized protein n=1 Tax=Ixodes persulcatus TaxID=34615 RepID=A0AC60QBQ1_IXOPE|nr:hypothetical protein HPB47_022026 [Ixodes persulcatus]